ncbi:LacI family DNA-binding transcriptional regulator [Rhodococcus sp. NPDC057014]|uniref:LacI family DNA-binding transcriptional regulator n=1 Tax=Rhodococcus sp. NPDC057014 TaxID=3346000 RepID=UPI003627C8A4
MPGTSESGAMKNTDRHAGTSERVPTLADVAREAGVVISTASRSFTNPPRVNARTRERIVEAADRLGYRPNALARALESGRTRTVGLVVSDITNPHFFGVDLRIRLLHTPADHLGRTARDGRALRRGSRSSGRQDEPR